MKKSVFCLVSNDSQATHLVDHLRSSGFSNEDISLLASGKDREDLNEFISNENVVRAEGDTFTTNERRADKGMKRSGKLTTEKHTKAPEGASVGGLTGGILGGSLGLLAGIGALAIPGLGPFIAAGPLMAALSGSGLGGGLGLLIGALVGSGIPEFEAKKYEEGLKQGNTLISVHCENDEELNKAKDIMKQEGATDISASREKASSKY